MINRKKLIEGLRYSAKWNDPVPEWVFNKIEAAPGIIRCKDCYHSRPGRMEPDKLFCGFLELWVQGEDYCCWGCKNDEY